MSAIIKSGQIKTLIVLHNTKSEAMFQTIIGKVTHLRYDLRFVAIPASFIYSKCYV